MKTKQPTTIMLVGGGSGGHVTPLVSIAKQLKASRPKLKLHYVGWRKDESAKELLWESGLVDEYSSVFSGKYRRYVGLTGRLRFIVKLKSLFYNTRDLFKLLIGFFQASWMMLRQRPDLVFSKGGFPAVPVCLAARIFRVPIITHDSDSVAGLAHKLVKNQAKYMLFGVKPAKMESNWRHVGVPISERFKQPFTNTQKSKLKQKYNVKTTDFVMVTGGGNGSRDLNLATIELAKAGLGPQTTIILQTGQKFYQHSLDIYKQLEAKPKHPILMIEFTKDMPELIMGSKFIITRAGATALAEIAAASKASIIVPHGNLPGGHQVQNADNFADVEASLVVDDPPGKPIDQRALEEAFSKLNTDENLRLQLASNANQLALANSSELVVKACFEVLG